MSTRRVWKIHRAGSIDRLRFVEHAAVPAQLAPGHARIAVKAVGLNFADVFACQGLYSATPKGEFTPGLEFAGVVEAVAPPSPEEKRAARKKKASGKKTNARDSLRPGDDVMGVIRFGAYTDRLDLPVHFLRKLPKKWSYAEGAAFLAQGFTAYYALHELGALKADDLVLVHSAAGGVGLIALDMIAQAGARAVATIGSESKIAVLQERCGLDRANIIVRDGKPDAKRFAAQLDAVLQHNHREGFALILDSLLGPYFQPAFDRLSPMGRSIVFGSASMMTHGNRPHYLKLAWRYLRRPRLDPLAMISANKSVMAFNLIWLMQHIQKFAELYDAMLSTKPRAPLIGHRFPLEKAVDALKFFQSGRSVGKVVLECD